MEHKMIIWEGKPRKNKQKKANYIVDKYFFNSTCRIQKTLVKFHFPKMHLVCDGLSIALPQHKEVLLPEERLRFFFTLMPNLYIHSTITKIIARGQ